MVLLIALTVPAAAQDTAQSRRIPIDRSALRQLDVTALPFYRHMAETAIRQRPDSFDFTAFRGHYSGTPQYDPLAESITNLMIRLSFEIKDKKDSAGSQKLLQDYANLVGDHLANIDVVTLAETLARDDVRFGDPEFYLWLRRGIMKSVLQSGDGKTLARAYDVITAGEETRLIAALGIQNPVRAERESAGLFYTIVDYADQKTGAKRSVFINTSVPKSFLLADRPSEDRIFSIAPDKSLNE